LSSGEKAKAIVDVFSDKAHKHLVYDALTRITDSDSPIDQALEVGQKTFLLRFFRVNLRRAFAASNGVNSEDARWR
jgi:hypothetical protein